MTPEPGRWYVDARPGHAGVPGTARFLVVRVDAETVDVEDEWGTRRRVNRIAFEAQMTGLEERL